MSHPRPTSTDETLGGLVHQLSEQVPHLIRSEVRLAQLEMTEKGKRAGIGVGMFSIAGVVALFAVACLIGAAIAALALVLPTWAAALVVAGALLVIAAVAALVGRARMKAAVPPTPEHAIEGVRRDLAAIKGETS